MTVTNDDARHAGARGARRVGVGPVADHEHFGRVELPSCRGDQNPARVRLESPDFRIRGAQHYGKAPADPKRLELEIGGVVRQDAELDAETAEKIEQGDEPLGAATWQV